MTKKKDKCTATIRMDPRLYKQLKEAAWERRISLNELCIAKLSTGLPYLTSEENAEEAIRQAH